jgi:hypothetical protein
LFTGLAPAGAAARAGKAGRPSRHPDTRDPGRLWAVWDQGALAVGQLAAPTWAPDSWGQPRDGPA